MNNTDLDESPMIAWAEAELRRAGLYDADSDYDGMLAEEVMRLIRDFCGRGHSGGSAYATLDLFARLACWKPLTALTNDPAEWMHIDEDMAGDAITWQSTRNGSCFSQDGGITYYDIDERQARWRRASEYVARRLRIYRPWQFHKLHTSRKVAHD